MALGSGVGGRRGALLAVAAVVPVRGGAFGGVADEGVPDVEPPVVARADEKVDAVHLEDVVARAVGDDGGGRFIVVVVVVVVVVVGGGG